MNIVTYTNAAHIKMCENMMLSAEKHFDITPYIYCMDKESKDYFLQTKWNTNVRECSFVACKSGALDWGTPDYRVLIRNKFFAIKEVLLETNLPVLFCDSDIFFFKNPIPYLESIHHQHSVNIITQTDPPHTPICTGFICLYPTQDVFTAIDFVNQQATDFSKVFDDQLGFIQAVYQNRLSFYSLEQSLFPNGNTFFNEKKLCPDKYIIHANYMVGHDTKVTALKGASAWIS